MRLHTVPKLAGIPSAAHYAHKWPMRETRLALVNSAVTYGHHNTSDTIDSRAVELPVVLRFPGRHASMHVIVELPCALALSRTVKLPQRLRTVGPVPLTE